MLSELGHAILPLEPQAQAQICWVAALFRRMTCPVILSFTELQPIEPLASEVLRVYHYCHYYHIHWVTSFVELSAGIEFFPSLLGNAQKPPAPA